MTTLELSFMKSVPAALASISESIDGLLAMKSGMPVVEFTDNHGTTHIEPFEGMEITEDEICRINGKTVSCEEFSELAKLVRDQMDFISKRGVDNPLRI